MPFLELDFLTTIHRSLSHLWSNQAPLTLQCSAYQSMISKQIIQICPLASHWPQGLPSSKADTREFQGLPSSKADTRENVNGWQWLAIMWGERRGPTTCLPALVFLDMKNKGLSKIENTYHNACYGHSFMIKCFRRENIGRYFATVIIDQDLIFVEFHSLLIKEAHLPQICLEY